MINRTKKVIKKGAGNRRTVCLYPKSINLYRFIRLVLGPGVRDAELARRWRTYSKNVHEFKTGRYPVPHIERLEQLARVLKVNKHIVFNVACGTSADKVFKLIKKNDLPGLIGVAKK